ncbi:MAG: ion transporter [Mycoplasma sp.]|nr:ion transporter [Mycoplasma sp.]
MSLSEKIINNNKLKFLNFICTSRSDYQQLDEKKLKKAKLFNWMYLSIIFIAIVISFIPLFFISSENELVIMDSKWMSALNIIVLIILTIDYLLRWITYPIRIKHNSVNPLLFFIFTSSSIMILASISSAVLFVTVSFLPNDKELIKVAKALSVLKIFRFILLLNIIPSFKILTEVFIRSRSIVFNLLLVLFSFIFIFALIIYSIEYSANPQINNYSDALYYSFITVCTVGFGDIVCVTNEGRFLSVILGILGSIAFAIPFGIVVGAFNVKIKEKYKNIDQMDVYSTTTLVEKTYLKLNKNRKTKNKSATIILNKILKKDSDISEKIISCLGGSDNIEVFEEIDNKKTKLVIINSNKINEHKLDLLLEILEIGYQYNHN